MNVFVVEEIFEIVGRGPVITRSQEVARSAWEQGERWKTGQTITCGSLIAMITGIERFAVPEGHAAHNDAALLLKGVDASELEPGQVWTLVH